ncbi:MAG TPA: DUF2252 family protein [Terriglobales bacterium]|nr:DUF2252 family protein [Terriglobales bacterium]
MSIPKAASTAALVFRYAPPIRFIPWMICRLSRTISLRQTPDISQIKSSSESRYREAIAAYGDEHPGSHDRLNAHARFALTFAHAGSIVGNRTAMHIVKATHRFEDWLGRHTMLVKADLRLKHQRMAEAAFPFLRATFYRWVQIWADICPALAKAPRVLAVGDLHLENFGTWRDIEGRLVWGVNDFDETAVLPYTIDLVRLATSALFAIEGGHLALKGKDACAAILEGYRESLAKHGRPFVLEEENEWLRQIATGALRDPVHFWKKMDTLPRVTGAIPMSAQEALEHLMPERGLGYRTVQRVAGLGSLGHVRVVAIALCHGARIAREAKALVPSCVYWATGHEGPSEIMYQTIISRAVRSPDPFVQLRGRWIVRRLSPHCCRIELSVLPTSRDELRLLSAMGWETANIHLGSANAQKHIGRHLNRLKPNWLLNAAKEMAEAVTGDWHSWKKSQRS